MAIIGGEADFFGLDIGTSAIRVVQLKGPGPIKNLAAYGQTAVDNAILVSDAATDHQRIAGVIKDLIKEAKISTKNVAVNVATNRVFMAVIDMDKLPPAELEKTMRYQADSLIPTPLAQSKVDWLVLGDSPKDPKKAEILISSVPNDYVEARLDMLESAGLNVVAIEPDSTALARAVMAPDVPTPQLVLDIGYSSADLLIAIDGLPRLSRALPYGSQAVVRAAEQALGVDSAQAQQYVFKFGLSKDKLDGQVYGAIINTIEGLMAEIDKSIKFFQGRYAGAKLDRLIVTGSASAMPELPLYIANKFNLNVEIGNAWRNVNYPPEQQNALAAISNHFPVAAGLAERQQA
ncbi:type IV pilus assembly protein PilM [Candidatus Saccharibacteria bacterium]|nr:type IV pilus assembly protein PilM [Candidatus Saccharibacteria bacterium]